MNQLPDLVPGNSRNIGILFSTFLNEAIWGCQKQQNPCKSLNFTILLAFLRGQRTFVSFFFFFLNYISSGFFLNWDDTGVVIFLIQTLQQEAGLTCELYC